MDGKLQGGRSDTLTILKEKSFSSPSHLLTLAIQRSCGGGKERASPHSLRVRFKGCSLLPLDESSLCEGATRAFLYFSCGRLRDSELRCSCDRASYYTHATVPDLLSR